MFGSIIDPKGKKIPGQTYNELDTTAAGGDQIKNLLKYMNVETTDDKAALGKKLGALQMAAEMGRRHLAGTKKKATKSSMVSDAGAGAGEPIPEDVPAERADAN